MSLKKNDDILKNAETVLNILVDEILAETIDTGDFDNDNILKMYYGI